MRRLLPAAAAAVLVLGLAGCGSSGESQTGARSGANASTGRAAPAATQGGAALFADLTDAMAKAKSARVTFASATGAQRVTGRGSFRFGDSLAADVSIAVPGQGNIRIVVLPEAFYLKLPASAGLPGGKPWMKIGAGSGDPLSNTFGPLLDQLKQSFDPGSNLGLLRSTTTVTRAGTERVGGVSTTRYTATVDLARAAAAASGGLAQQYQALVAAGTKTVSYSIWVDGQSLPRKFSTTIPSAQGAVTARGTYDDWGKPVSVQAPAADQVATAGDLGGLGAPTVG